MIFRDIFFFNHTATTEIYTLSLHDALPIWGVARRPPGDRDRSAPTSPASTDTIAGATNTPMRTEEDRWAASGGSSAVSRSEEHTSELQSRQYLVCRLLLEKKNRI